MEFSVLVVTHNHGHYLQRALRSAAVAAGNRSYEILVCDDGSTDHTADVVGALRQELPLYYFRDEKAETVAQVRNRALERARGEWFVFLDADDLLLPGHLTGLRAGAPICYGRWQEPQGDGKTGIHEIPITRHGTQFPALGACLFSRTLVQAGFRFHPTLPVCEDLDWFLQLQRAEIESYRLPQQVLIRSMEPGRLSERYDREVWSAYVRRRGRRG
jgi:glycosyltransferase involved in cell wall biosynthesis